MEGPKPSQADFTKTISVVLLSEYLATSLAHAASIALADATPAVAMTARIAALWLFAGMLAINLATMAGAFAMRRSENAPFARTSLAMTGGLAAIMVASWMNDRLVFHAGAAALTASMLLLTIFAADGKFLKPNPR